MYLLGTTSPLYLLISQRSPNPSNAPALARLGFPKAAMPPHPVVSVFYEMRGSLRVAEPDEPDDHQGSNQAPLSFEQERLGWFSAMW